MPKITNNIVERAYTIGKQIYKNEVSLKSGVQTLEHFGMNESSAHDYIYSYSNLIQGKLFTRTTNAYGTEYYLKMIYEEEGKTGLENALLSLSQHIDYYEQKTGSQVKKRKDIYKKYLDILDIDEDYIIYPEDLNSGEEYSEGKGKLITVNRYERNPIARKRCIEHYGWNCQVCELNFQSRYGNIGKTFIHVHHKIELHTIGKEYSVNPITDLIPVCPNCHSMLHKRKPAYSTEELKEILI
jgi:5-methylcytosine-specific restriction protein A